MPLLRSRGDGVMSRAVECVSNRLRNVVQRIASIDRTGHMPHPYKTCQRYPSGETPRSRKPKWWDIKGSPSCGVDSKVRLIIRRKSFTLTERPRRNLHLFVFPTSSFSDASRSSRLFNDYLNARLLSVSKLVAATSLVPVLTSSRESGCPSLARSARLT